MRGQDITISSSMADAIEVEMKALKVPLDPSLSDIQFQTLGKDIF